ncbi:MAG TPA: DUF4442 domain-containing protein [Flavobacteriaceae bacterium]|nr:DUF4442 domain-containing protein [Flavobacteriaceae bacterium]
MKFLRYNLFLLKKLPSAYFCGARIKSIDSNQCEIKIALNWFNKNPYKSMFWAAQGMAAELTTALMITDKIKKSGYDVSMLLISNNANYYKKATGLIVFNCNEGAEIDEMMNKLISSNTPQTITLSSTGINQNNVTVSKFIFEWSLKIREK